MLKKFTVSGFRAFNSQLSVDFTARNYDYNCDLTANGLIKNAMVYGKNGCGKSSLGYALFDLTSQLTDKEWSIKRSNEFAYCNLKQSNMIATFDYVFEFDGQEVMYSAGKRDRSSLAWEKLTISGERVVDWDFEGNRRYINEKLVGRLQMRISDNKLSVVKYVARSLPRGTMPLLDRLMNFVDRMLWYRSLSEGHSYIGFTNGGTSLVGEIYRQGKLGEFKDFLKRNDLEYDLDFELVNGVPILMAYFEKRRRKINFELIESTGTRTLLLFFFWKIFAFDKVSFLFIDEFDAFFHFETAAEILKTLNAMKCQTMVTSHNTYLMSNELTRPDCCFIMTPENFTPLCNATAKEIRQAHNLSKMYVNGAFSA